MVVVTSSPLASSAWPRLLAVLGRTARFDELRQERDQLSAPGRVVDRLHFHNDVDGGRLWFPGQLFPLRCFRFAIARSMAWWSW